MLAQRGEHLRTISVGPRSQAGTTAALDATCDAAFAPLGETIVQP